MFQNRVNGGISSSSDVVGDDFSDVANDDSAAKIVHHVRIVGKPIGLPTPSSELHRELDMKVKIVVFKDHI